MRRFRFATLVCIVVSLSVLTLSGCGGGGGSGTTTGGSTGGTLGGTPPISPTSPTVSNFQVTPVQASQGSGMADISGTCQCAPGGADLSTITITVSDQFDKQLTVETMPIQNASGGPATIIFQVDTSTAGTFSIKVFVTDVFGSNSNTLTTAFAILNPPTQGPIWKTGSPMPTVRGGLGAGVIDGKLYAVGGEDGSGHPANATECYDPGTDTWTTKAPMPTGGGVVAVVLEDKLYALGACSAKNICNMVEQYDPKTDAWTVKAPMPVSYSTSSPGPYFAAGVINGRIYCTGASTRSIYYDPGQDAWTVMPAPARGDWGWTGVALGNRLYLAGGTIGDEIYRSFVAWDPAANAYTSEAAMPVALCFLTAAVPDGRIYVIGGDGYGPNDKGLTYQAYNTVEQYDASTAKWTTKTPMPTAREALASGVINGKIYVVGGFEKTIGVPCNTLEIYDPAVDH